LFSTNKYNLKDEVNSAKSVLFLKTANALIAFQHLHEAFASAFLIGSLQIQPDAKG
jgi:hypothetical protein